MGDLVQRDYMGGRILSNRMVVHEELELTVIARYC